MSDPENGRYAADGYIEGLIRLGPPGLDAVLARYAEHPLAQPPIGPQVAAFLVWLVHALDARRVLELGTSLGYSTVALAAALERKGGRLVAVEKEGELIEETRTALRVANLLDRVELHHADLLVDLDHLAGHFDQIVQDAAKDLYPQTLDRCVELLRPGGVLAADDALFPPMGLRAELAGPIDEFNRRVVAHPDFAAATILPIGDGLMIAVKRRG